MVLVQDVLKQNLVIFFRLEQSMVWFIGCVLYRRYAHLSGFPGGFRLGKYASFIRF